MEVGLEDGEFDIGDCHDRIYADNNGYSDGEDNVVDDDINSIKEDAHCRELISWRLLVASMSHPDAM